MIPIIVPTLSPAIFMNLDSNHKHCKPKDDWCSDEVRMRGILFAPTCFFHHLIVAPINSYLFHARALRQKYQVQFTGNETNHIMRKITRTATCYWMMLFSGSSDQAPELILIHIEISFEKSLTGFRGVFLMQINLFFCWSWNKFRLMISWCCPTLWIGGVDWDELLYQP